MTALINRVSSSHKRMQSTSAENRVAIWHSPNYAQVANKPTAFLLRAFNRTNRNSTDLTTSRAPLSFHFIVISCLCCFCFCNFKAIFINIQNCIIQRDLTVGTTKCITTLLHFLLSEFETMLFAKIYDQCNCDNQRYDNLQKFYFLGQRRYIASKQWWLTKKHQIQLRECVIQILFEGRFYARANRTCYSDTFPHNSPTDGARELIETPKMQKGHLVSEKVI